MHGAVIKRAQIEQFNVDMAAFAKSPNEEIEMHSVTDRLVQVQHQAEKHNAVIGAIPALEALITSHAHFPFTNPVMLTRDALLRAVLLLTDHASLPFRQACQVGDDYEIRTHSEKERLRFIYSALACSPIGVPTQDDVLDVVSRVEYPWRTWAKGIIRRQLLDDFRPLAERLAPARDVEVPESLPVKKLEPLRELATAFPLRWGDPAAVVGFGGEGAVTREQFVEWATKVRNYPRAMVLYLAKS
ncbi:uncharacterized protein CC84DRAFT_1167459 [Paraphaeosphaeria sporulosa]|uniref:Uncharacterized protein n=1 Tax=Paraphaeosphaeria sporulosa TaxID=1460663 RepID=A0A177C4H5_9PLEO|nr:uncharacterized protein CC84DRAFT_1167459 [Paraphaeosphaeria sporulosa]OAG02405.1 hypothetical protein CC84DRAFT_1167459 [Paraphaeosphaeria sporulosa]